VVERRPAAWRSRRLGDFRRMMSNGCIAKSGEASAAPRTSLSTLRVLYSSCTVAPELYQGVSCEGFTLNRETKRTRYLIPAELPQMFAALKRAPES